MNEKQKYIEQLQLMGSLSRLFSENTKPYLYYRVAENIYSSAFGAKNVGRSDIAIDAIRDGVGVGLKTFTGHKGKSSYQKVAEFNSNKPELDVILQTGDNLQFVQRISQLRNTRIDFALNAFGLSGAIYHSVVRDDRKFSIFEEPMHRINTETIANVSNDKKIIKFTDGIEDYKFVLSKSTLYKRFREDAPLYSFDVEILEDPINELLTKLPQQMAPLIDDDSGAQSVILPLYSTAPATYGEVPERSGLNQWNANGRPRHEYEVYVPIPAWIHRVFEGFFPSRDEPFDIELPSGRKLSMKVSQSGDKALMSNPNKELGEWLFTTGLRLPAGTLVTKEILDKMGIDSVEVSKHDDVYRLDLKHTGSYEEFRNENQPD